MHRSVLLISILLLLTSCSTGRDTQITEKIPISDEVADELLDPRLSRIRQNEDCVLVLLPMSGSNESIGKNVLNACLLGIDTNNARNIDFYLMDTADVSREKFTFSDRLKNKKFKAIIGPVFSNEVKQYGALFPTTTILSLSNNISKNSDHVFACGLSIQNEINALVKYANSNEINSFLIILPEGNLGDQIIDIIKSELKGFDGDEGEDLEIIRYRSISRKAATKYVKNSNKKAVFIIDPILTISKLEDIQVFTLSSAALAKSEVWNGVIFAFSDNPKQNKFVEKYKSIFKTNPTILDMVGYDLMQLVTEFINLGKPIFQNMHNGCLGEFSIDRKNGLRRKLQIFRIENSQKVMVEPD